MIFYHIDSNCTIQKPGILYPYDVPPEHPIYEKFPNLSAHGVHYVLHNGEESVASKMTEIILDYVRSSKFPHLPSRWRCIFASKTFEQAKLWMPYIATEQYQIVKIETNNYLELDASWFTTTAQTGTQLTSFKNRDYVMPSSFARMYEEAFRYWSGEHSNSPLLEVLIPLPIRITEIIPLDSLPCV